MKVRIVRLAAVAALSITAAFTSAFAEDTPAGDDSLLTLDTSVAVLSDYIDRGQNVYDGLSIQPTASLTYSLEDAGSFGAAFWWHLPGEGDRQSEKFVETNFTLRYDVKLGIFDFGVGNTWIDYQTDEEGYFDTQEWFAAVLIDTYLKPTFAFIHDYKTSDNLYYELTLSHDLSLAGEGGEITLTPYVTLGFSTNSYKVYDREGLEFTTIGVNAEFPAGPLTMTPTLNYTFKSDPTCANELWMGIVLGYSRGLY